MHRDGGVARRRFAGPAGRVYFGAVIPRLRPSYEKPATSERDPPDCARSMKRKCCSENRPRCTYAIISFVNSLGTVIWLIFLIDLIFFLAHFNHLIASINQIIVQTILRGTNHPSSTHHLQLATCDLHRHPCKYLVILPQADMENADRIHPY